MFMITLSYWNITFGLQNRSDFWDFWDGLNKIKCVFCELCDLKQFKDIKSPEIFELIFSNK